MTFLYWRQGRGHLSRKPVRKGKIRWTLPASLFCGVDGCRVEEKGAFGVLFDFCHFHPGASVRPAHTASIFLMYMELCVFMGASWRIVQRTKHLHLIIIQPITIGILTHQVVTCISAGSLKNEFQVGPGRRNFQIGPIKAYIYFQIAPIKKIRILANRTDKETVKSGR